VSGRRGTFGLVPSLAAAVVSLALAAGPDRPGRPPRAVHPTSELLLDGVRTRVRWTDGDTFRVLEGPHRGRSTRLAGVNALETHGPVHRWGAWAPPELWAIALESAAIAASAASECTVGRPDRYGRLLVDCPQAAAELVRRGHAMVFAVEGAADPALLALQQAAQAAGAGMWAKGVPRALVTSVHSTAEPGLSRGAYDRVVDTRTGLARAHPHHRAYPVCEWVCAGTPEDGSCMLYVPFERRYRHRPPCLRASAPTEGAEGPAGPTSDAAP
jgi:endonuclease YncB( thermonuclease family)